MSGVFLLFSWTIEQTHSTETCTGHVGTQILQSVILAFTDCGFRSAVQNFLGSMSHCPFPEFPKWPLHVFRKVLSTLIVQVSAESITSIM